MKKYFSLLTVFFIMLVFQNQTKSQEIYACSASSDSSDIYILSPTNCSCTLLCSDTFIFYDIAFEGGVLYGTAVGIDSTYHAYNYISKIDTITGIETVISKKTHQVFKGLVGDGGGHLYIVGSDTLFKYDIATSVYSAIGKTGYECEGDLAFKAGKLYMLEAENDTSFLIKINLSPFSCSKVGALNFGDKYMSYGLVTISSSGITTMYASVLDSLNRNYLYKINEENAATTLICSYGSNIEGKIFGLASATWECTAYSTNNPQTICNGSSYVFNGHTYTTAGNYFDTLATIHGCDSIIKTQLTINPAFLSNYQHSICNGDSYAFNGHTYSMPGNYYDSLTTVLGCDSVIELSLVVYPTDTTLQFQAICQGSDYNFYGTLLTTAGIYYHTFVSSHGCDSVIAANINVNPVLHSNNPQVICNGNAYVLNGHTYTTPGNYYDTLTTVHGCDSIITTNLTVNPLPIIVAGKDTTLYVGNSTQLYASGGVSYHWSPSTYLNNPNISDPISTPLNNISYVVIISDTNGCSAKDTVNIIAKESNLWIPNVFDPNNSDPVNQTFHISGNGIKDLEFVIYDRWGEKVFESNDINQGWDGTFKGEKLSKGVFVYYVKATYYNGQEVEKKGNVSLIR